MGVEVVSKKKKKMKKKYWVVFFFFIFYSKARERKTSELGKCNHGDTRGFYSVCVCVRVRV